MRERRARCKDNASIFAYEDVGPTSALLRVLHYISLKKKNPVAIITPNLFV